MRGFVAEDPTRGGEAEAVMLGSPGAVAPTAMAEDGAGATEVRLGRAAPLGGASASGFGGSTTSKRGVDERGKTAPDVGELVASKGEATVEWKVNAASHGRVSE
jgi:hypothetical protein